MLKINISQEAEHALREAWGTDLDRVTLEALVIEGYRSRKLGISQVRRLLGFESRWEAEEWLGQRGVAWNYSPEDLKADRLTLDRVFGHEC